MSLINDALKRAAQTQPPPPPSDANLMEPAQATATPASPQLVLPLAFAGLAAVGFWFIVKGIEAARRSGSQPSIVAAREIAATAPLPATAPAPAPSSPHPQTETAVVPAPTASPNPSSPAAPLPAPPSTTTPVPPQPSPPTFPDLKLQAVFYRPKNAAVVINSQTLEVGQRIQDARIVSISSQSVRVEWRGEIRELLLP